MDVYGKKRSYLLLPMSAAANLGVIVLGVQGCCKVLETCSVEGNDCSLNSKYQNLISQEQKYPKQESSDQHMFFKRRTGLDKASESVDSSVEHTLKPKPKDMNIIWLGLPMYSSS
ncbi:hypothetical protein ACH5RR_041119 [Cinchona calisaya]|uniref:Uncharacterized protein n=1 Tax=Cinchona calisaya TaxID=153742 RepID=A0ABD2XT04_9GENT